MRREKILCIWYIFIFFIIVFLPNLNLAETVSTNQAVKAPSTPLILQSLNLSDPVLPEFNIEGTQILSIQFLAMPTSMVTTTQIPYRPNIEEVVNTPNSIQEANLTDQTNDIMDDTEWLVSVNINSQATQEVVYALETADKKIWISADDLTHWRFLLPTATITKNYLDKTYYPLSAFTGLTYKIDPVNLKLDITAPANLFESSQINAITTSPKAQPSTPGGFINYDVFTQRSPGAEQNNGLFELGFFNQNGVGSSDFVATQTNVSRNSDSTYDNDSNGSKLTRLETVWTKDDPDHVRTLRLGDSVSQTGMWGSSVGFGGIQYATNFATQPSLITNPLPSTSGAAIVPSSVDLYVNNTLLNRKNVAPGPFAINNIPVVNGAGTLSVVTTDILGRQQITNIPFYTSSNLLNPGLHNFSYETGFTRDNFGTASADYGRIFASGTDTMGITNNLTGQWHAELLRDQQTGGIGGYWLWNNAAIFNASLAASRTNNGGIGELAVFGVQRQVIGIMNMGANVQVTSHAFTDLGIQEGQLAPSLQMQTFVGFPIRTSSVGLSYTRLNNRNGLPNNSILSLSYQKSLLKGLSLSVSALSNIGGENNKTLGIFLIYSLPHNTSININNNMQAGQTGQTFFDVNKALPIGPGYGYDIRSTQGNQENYQAMFTAQNDIGTYTAQAEHAAGSPNTYQLEAKGGIAIIDNRPYLSRNIYSSFGLIEMPGFPNTRIYQFNQLAGYTDSNGNLLVPNLLAYQNNKLSVETNDLPIDAIVNTDQTNVVPYYRSGLIVHFPIKVSHGATFIVVDEQNKPLPENTEIKYADDRQTDEAFITIENGQVYVSGLEAHNIMKAIVNGDICEFTIDYPEHADPIPDLGTLTCKMVPRND